MEKIEEFLDKQKKRLSHMESYGYVLGTDKHWLIEQLHSTRKMVEILLRHEPDYCEWDSLVRKCEELLD